jgi:hypothetical protein
MSALMTFAQEVQTFDVAKYGGLLPQMQGKIVVTP